MDDDDLITYESDSAGEDGAESWLAEQARLVLLEDGS
jgi:hypothetical protein